MYRCCCSIVLTVLLVGGSQELVGIILYNRYGNSVIIFTSQFLFFKSLICYCYYSTTPATVLLLRQAPSFLAVRAHGVVPLLWKHSQRAAELSYICVLKSLYQRSIQHLPSLLPSCRALQQYKLTAAQIWSLSTQQLHSILTFECSFLAPCQKKKGVHDRQHSGQTFRCFLWRIVPWQLAVWIEMLWVGKVLRRVVKHSPADGLK